MKQLPAQSLVQLVSYRPNVLGRPAVSGFLRRVAAIANKEIPPRFARLNEF